MLEPEFSKALAAQNIVGTNVVGQLQYVSSALRRERASNEKAVLSVGGVDAAQRVGVRSIIHVLRLRCWVYMVLQGRNEAQAKCKVNRKGDKKMRYLRYAELMAYAQGSLSRSKSAI